MTEPDRRGLRGEGLVLGGVLALAALVHLAAFARDFVWDDLITLDRMRLVGGWRLLEPDAFGFVRPGKEALFSLLAATFGERPAAWQAVSLAVLLGCGAVVYFLTRCLAGPWAAGIAVLVYTLHPLHVEATAWASGVNGAVAALVAGLGVLAWWRDSREPRFALLAGGAFAMLLGVAFKEDAVAAPGAALLTIWAVNKGEAGRVLARHGTVAGIVTVAGIALVMGMRLLASAVERGAAPLPVEGPPVGLLAPGCVFLHVLAFVWPFPWWHYVMFNGLSPFVQTMGMLGWVGGLLLAAGLVLGANPPRWALLLGAGAICLVPASNVLPFGNDWFGLRYLALPGMFFAAAAGVVAGTGLRGGGRGRLLTAMVAGAWLTGAALATVRGHVVWASETSLFSRLAEESPRSVYSVNLARLALGDGRPEAAEEHARGALGLEPLNTRAAVLLGRALRAQGRREEALAAWEEAYRHSPGDPELAVAIASFFDDLYQASGEAEFRERALTYYEVASRGSGPNAEIAFLNIGVLHAMEGDEAAALEIWEAGLERFPASEDLGRNAAIARVRLAEQLPEP